MERIAQAARVDPELAEKFDERPDPWVNRLVRALWQGGLMRGTMAGPMPELFDADTMASFSQRAIEEAADIGNCVIVGRASQCILQQRSDAFHVFIYAPRADRLHRVRSRHASAAEAEAALKARDQERAALIRRYFNQDWSNRHLYDLMICSKLGEETVLATVLSCDGIGTQLRSTRGTSVAESPYPGSSSKFWLENTNLFRTAERAHTYVRADRAGSAV